jgi:hypothetical protein
VIETSNAENLGMAVASAAYQTVIYELADYDSDEFNPSCEDAGNRTEENNENNSEDWWNIKTTYDECTFTNDEETTVVFDGTIDRTYDGASDSSSEIFDVTVSFNDDPEDLNSTLSCDGVSTSSQTCLLEEAEFVGFDDRLFEVEGLAANGDWASGYYISGFVNDPDNGSVTMTTGDTPITYSDDCEVPVTGIVNLSGTDDTSATITFVSCLEFNVTIDGVANTYYW